MIKIKRFGIFLAIGIAIALLVASLPLSRFGLTMVHADYGVSAEGTCGTGVSYQLFIRTGAPYYAEAGLVHLLGNLAADQKLLSCDPAVALKGATSYPVFVGSANLVYVSAADVTAIKGRGAQ